MYFMRTSHSSSDRHAMVGSMSASLIDIKDRHTISHDASCTPRADDGRCTLWAGAERGALISAVRVW